LTSSDTTPLDAAGLAIGLAEKLREGLERGTDLPATGIVEKEGVSPRLGNLDLDHARLLAEARRN